MNIQKLPLYSLFPFTQPNRKQFYHTYEHKQHNALLREPFEMESPPSVHTNPDIFKTA